MRMMRIRMMIDAVLFADEGYKKGEPIVRLM